MLAKAGHLSPNAIKCLEPNMDKMKVPNREHDDESFFSDDYVEIFLIPGLDPNGTVYQVMINCAGMTWEAKDKKPEGWNPKIEVKASRESDYWVVEMVVPLAEISANIPRPQWRMNIGRSRPARGDAPAQEVSWAILNSTSSHTYQKFHAVTIESLEKQK